MSPLYNVCWHTQILLTQTACPPQLAIIESANADPTISRLVTKKINEGTIGCSKGFVVILTASLEWPDATVVHLNTIFGTNQTILDGRDGRFVEIAKLPAFDRMEWSGEKPQASKLVSETPRNAVIMSRSR